MNDISLSTYPNWTPIGKVTDLSLGTGTPFSGNFNGNDFTITGLTIAVSAMTPQIGFGLFGYVGATGTVSNLNVTGVSITISIASKKYVAGLVGANQGTVDSCSTSGILSNANLGAESIGGLVGENYGIASMVKNSHSSVNVTGGSYAGGLVGINYGTIDSCYAIGTINGIGTLGGLVGQNASTSATGLGVVKNSHATGNVTGTGIVSDNIGGLIGRNRFEGTHSTVGYIENCYATGAASGAGNCIGGFIGRISANNAGTTGGGYIKDCHAAGNIAWMQRNPANTG
jgi:hypothetical protein